MSDAVYCKQCGVNDDQQAKCDGCNEMVPHEELVHYDGGVFCQECDEWVEEDMNEEDEE